MTVLVTRELVPASQLGQHSLLLRISPKSLRSSGKFRSFL